MLRELSIENVAVIEKAVVEFGDGLNVLTGETGAGKSILIDSINAILGNRTTREIVRSGEERSVIFATFEDVDADFAKRVEQQGFECDGTLILHREITADGKSQCRINGRPATAATVREVCEGLINIHGQHDNQDLLNPEKHIDIIDAFAELEADVAQYSAIFSETADVKRQINEISRTEQDKTKRIELLSYQIDEIEKAELSLEEEKELNEKRVFMRNSEKILDAIKNAYAIISGDGETDGAMSMLFTASGLLESVEGISGDIDGCAARLSEAYYNINDVSSELSSYLDSFDFDAAEVAAVEERLDLIYRMKSKYGSTLEEVLAYYEDAKKELEDITLASERLDTLNSRFEKLVGELRERAERIENARKAAIPVFEKRIMDELSFLNMPDVSFVVDIKTGQLNRNGRNTVEFLVSANAGEPPKPINRIASGGELSRIMLSIKNALADKDNIGTLIFDEIDTGVSGSSAGRIGKKLKQSAKSRQTICVTHSAQIAAYADEHLFIQKSVRDGKTFTQITKLNDEERVHELARIVSGDNVTATALENAREMLSLARA